MTTTVETHQISLPIPVAAELRQIATDERRTMSGILTLAFEEWNDRRLGKVKEPIARPDRLGI